MKNILKLLGGCFVASAAAQQPLFIPDTLSGSTITLNMHADSVQFLLGIKTSTYAYNSYSYLGPTLILNNGANVSLVVNNQLADTSTVHWHGLHVAAINDGGPHTPILPGATWNPQFTVMNSAATYWYHPHTHMKTAEQAIKGADGMIIVRDNAEAALSLPRRYGVDDFPIIVQSVQFDSLNQLMPLGMQDSSLMVNGTMNPFVNLPSQVVRLRLLNASGERVMNFGFTANKSFYIIASDGGLMSAPILTTRVRLAPGERAEVLIDLIGMNGQVVNLMSYGSELPMGVQGGPTMPMPIGSPPMDSPLNGIDYNLLQINVVAQTLNPVTTIPSSLVPLNPWLESQANITRTIAMNAPSAMSMDGPFTFNNLSFDMMRIDYQIPLDNIEIWELTNQTMVAHPFHIHDVQFYLLDRDGNLPPLHERGKKDVVLIESNETVRFITKFEDFADTLTPYMFHCHILMHEDDGMMGQFLVVPATSGMNDVIVNDGFRLFPNPIKDKFSVQLLDKLDKVLILEIHNLLGEIVYSYNFKSNEIIDLDLSMLNAGTYIAKVKTEKNNFVQKIIKN